MMKHLTRLAVITAALALTAPAFAAAAQPEGSPPYGKGQGKGPNYVPGDQTPGDNTPGPKAGLPEKAKAYGRYCQGTSKKHVKGEKGTEFSRCVNAMAKAANSESKAAKQACKGLSKKHVKGEKGTEFSRCVKAAAQLKRDQKREEREQAEDAS
jgi:hypothetical protein